jgi:syntaxin-binding protein 1
VTPLSPRSPPPQTTSLRSQKPAWHRAPKTATVPDNRERIIVFVAGGMTYSEMREIYHLSDTLQKDIYIGMSVRISSSCTVDIVLGSTHTVTPRGFIDDLKVLELGGAGSRAVPNGLRDMRGDRKSFQELYDTKYYVKEAPVPIRQQNLAPPRKTERPTIIQPSPTSSFQSSTISSNDGNPLRTKRKRNGLSLDYVHSQIVLHELALVSPQHIRNLE